jgi:hypothetical protein
MILLPGNPRDSNPPARWWRPVQPSGTWVSISCPTCGQGLSIKRASAGHDVDVDGKVTPSVVCTHPGCTFHDMVVLEGWMP